MMCLRSTDSLYSMYSLVLRATRVSLENSLAFRAGISTGAKHE